MITQCVMVQIIRKRKETIGLGVGNPLSYMIEKIYVWYHLLAWSQILLESDDPKRSMLSTELV